MKSSDLQEVILELLADGKVYSVQAIKEYLSQKGLIDYTEGQFAGSLTTLIRNNTIKKITRGQYTLQRNEDDKRSGNMKKCFVVSPIGADESEIRKNADKLFKHIIKPVCEECGFEPIRVDQLNNADSITNDIIEHLEKSELVIADLSGNNPNVFFELGYRSRTKKPMIQLKSNTNNLPFDVAAIRTFDYDLTDLDAVENLKERLINTIQSFDYPEINESDSGESVDKELSSVMPLLYNILDAIKVVESKVDKSSNEALSTAINTTLQASKPQMSGETALQAQLINAMMQNPDNFLKLYWLFSNHESTDNENK